MLQCAIRPEDARAFPINGWYAGTDAVQKGEAFVYDFDYGTATDADDSRVNRVQRPLTTGGAWMRMFAGVAARDYTAKATGQKIELLAPGSVADIAILGAPTLGDVVTAIATTASTVKNSGRFGPSGFRGRGTATVLQTIAAHTDPLTFTDNVVFGSLLDGTASLAISGTTYTLTATTGSPFTGVPATASLKGNEYVHITGGAALAVPVVAGRYKITAKTSNTVVVLDPAGTAPAASTVTCNIYAVRNNPTVPALLDGSPAGGEESGLTEHFTIVESGTADSMIGGFTYGVGGHTLTAAGHADVIVNGTFIGQRKGYRLLGALTTNGWVITGTSSNIVALMTTLPVTQTDADDFLPKVLVSVTLNAAIEGLILNYNGVVWNVVGVTVSAVAA